MRNILASLLLLVVLAADVRAAANDYLILDLAGPDDPDKAQTRFVDREPSP